MKYLHKAQRVLREWEWGWGWYDIETLDQFHN